MHKRMTIRLVDELAESLQESAKKRGLSVNALITEMAWDFVDSWQSQKEHCPTKAS